MEWVDDGYTPSSGSTEESTLGVAFEPGEKRQLQPSEEDYITIFSFLKSIDPTIEGFQTAIVNKDGSWACIVLYPSGEQGVIEGRGTQVLSMRGGSHFNIVPHDVLARRMEADPDHAFDDWFDSPRE